MKEEFKLFVRNKPELIDYVTKGEMTWQKFYEIWSLYGSDNKVWDKYKSIENKTDNNFNMSNIMDTIKKVDVNSLKKGINGFQKMIELLQGFLVKDNVSNTSNYEPRKLFQKFED